MLAGRGTHKARRRSWLTTEPAVTCAVTPTNRHATVIMAKQWPQVPRDTFRPTFSAPTPPRLSFSVVGLGGAGLLGHLSAMRHPRLRWEDGGHALPSSGQNGRSRRWTASAHGARAPAVASRSAGKGGSSATVDGRTVGREISWPRASWTGRLALSGTMETTPRSIRGHRGRNGDGHSGMAIDAAGVRSS